MTARGDSLGQRIRQAYVDAGLNRSQFQRALGVAYSTVLMWERDRTQPNADNLRLISEITGKPVDVLLAPSSQKPSQLDGGRRYADVLTRFLASAAGRSATEHERHTLESILFHHMKPTPQALAMMLAALRSCKRVRKPAKKG
ncbi:MAG: helix-turn-helix transcriptional regulator [Myxococcales bacterium]|nr:helix-turn-helix transcriptional regulator [Myxococcales bacterium]